MSRRMTTTIAVDRAGLRSLLLFACGAVALGAFAWQTGIDGCQTLVFLVAGIHLVTEHALFGYEGLRQADEPEGTRRALLVPAILLAIYAALLRTDPGLAFQIAFAARGVHHAIGYAHFLSETRNPFARDRLTLVGAGGVWLLALALSAAEQRWDLFFLVDFLGHALAWGVACGMRRVARANETGPRHPVRAFVSVAAVLGLTTAFFWLAGGGIAPEGTAGSPIGPAGAFAAAWIPHYVIEGHALWRRW